MQLSPRSVFKLGLGDAPVLAALTAAYWATAVAGLQYTVAPGAGTAFWPAAGIAFAVLLVAGPQHWPAIFMGRLLAALTVSSPQPLWADILIAAGTTLAAVVPIVPMRRLSGFDISLGNLRDMLWLILGGAVLGALISASIGAVALWASGTPQAAVAGAFVTWAFGYGVGILVVAPLLLSWGPPSARVLTARQWAHLALCLGAIAVLGWAIFLERMIPLRTWHLFPAMVWAALAFNVRGAAAALVIASAVAMWSAIAGVGPLATIGEDAPGRLLFGQQFVATTAIAILTLAAVADERRGKERLRHSERQFRAVFELAGVGLAQGEPNGALVRVNPRYCEITGRSEAELLGRTTAELVHPEDRERAANSFERMLSDSSTHLIEKRFVRPDGGIVWVRSNAVAIRDERGDPVGVISVIDDITEQRVAEEALREETQALETLNRTGAAIAAELDLARLVQGVTDAGVALTGAQFGAFFYNVLDEAGESYRLYALSGAPREAFDRFGHPRNTKVFEPTFSGKTIVRVDDIMADPRYGQMAPHHGLPERHLPVRSYLAVPVTSRSGEVIGALFFGHAKPGVFTERAERLVVGIAAQAAIGIDNARLYQEAQREIAERTRAEEHQRLLINELNHRVKNTLATVQSIAAQTLRSTDTVEEAKSAFTARLLALAAAHDVLTGESWEGADLRDIVAGAIQPFESPEAARFVIDGPRAWLEPRAALSIALALHELGTNAAKYGALSTGAGRVRISWTVEPRGAGTALSMTWREENGPPVTPPARTGFGTRLIERGLAADLKGKASMRFEPDGLVCAIEALLPQPGQEAPPAA